MKRAIRSMLRNGFTHQVVAAAVAVVSAAAGGVAVVLVAGLVPAILVVCSIFCVVYGCLYQVGRLHDAGLREARALWALGQSVQSMQPWPAPGEWALGADALTYLGRECARRGAVTVVELGPGVSSLCLPRIAPKASFVGVEHDPAYFELVSELLRLHGLTERYELLHRPLQQDGVQAGWYSVSRSDLPSAIDVLLIDGPPVLPGEFHRDRCIPVLEELLAPGALVVVDDTGRRTERRMVEDWVASRKCRVAYDGGTFVALEWGGSRA